MPRRPSSPSARISRSGNVLARSRSPARGASSRSAEARAVSTIRRCSSSGSKSTDPFISRPTAASLRPFREACTNLPAVSSTSPIVTPAQRVLFLARHGETAWNLEQRWQGQTDVTLNDAGRAQAAALAARLAAHRITRIVASDLSRARETAEIIARGLGIDGVLLDAGLRERGYGIFEGLTRGECEAQHPE